MICPVLEHEIQAHKKAAEIARELSHTGYCPTICKSRRVAEFEQEHLERITDFELVIKVMMK